MPDHASLGVSDLERSRRFYDAAPHPRGITRSVDFAERGSDPDGHRIDAMCRAPDAPTVLSSQ
jgi:catechol 2,3-dioxygenase-like lactoylglutathione lyase family enzyme